MTPAVGAAGGGWAEVKATPCRWTCCLPSGSGIAPWRGGRARGAVEPRAAAAVGEADRHAIDDDAELDVGLLRIGPHVRQVGKHQDRALLGEVPSHSHGVAWQLGPRGAVARAELVPGRGDELVLVRGLHAEAPRDVASRSSDLIAIAIVIAIAVVGRVELDALAVAACQRISAPRPGVRTQLAPRAPAAPETKWIGPWLVGRVAGEEGEADVLGAIDGDAQLRVDVVHAVRHLVRGAVGVRVE
eukprot:scaffold44120_cov57-Phaeocystis_antarctica.AAC.1